MITMGEKLHKIRSEKNLSLREAAKILGVSHTYLDMLEKGYNPQTGKPINPTAEILQQISIGYKIPVEELFMSDQDTDEEDSFDAAAIADRIEKLRPEDRNLVVCLVDRLDRD